MDGEKQTSGILIQTMEDVMHNCMMPYSEHVILDRALPRVEDGLKPVQRRILYSMNELGVTGDKPYRKSARIVGDCLGKYHPHGDKSVYDAMVRLAQPFNLRHTLVDGHGNFGSVDGDSAAAMRYTEARLAPLAAEMLRDLDKDTVHWSLNFDDTTKEPDTLPGRFPNLLVNGAYGIAVGLATNIPPHNLGEVIDGVIAYIENPRVKCKEMMRIIKGPDFPTGGSCVCGEELIRAYETGRGKVTMYPTMKIEIGDNDKRNIVITELPYQVNKKTLLESIVELREEKKNGALAGIAEICDESDRDGMRAVIRLKRDCDPKDIIAVLFKSTNLMTTFGINMVAIADGKPQQMGLLDIIAYYVEYQRDVVIRRTKYDLDAAKEREHILGGLIIAIRAIDEVVAIIKKADSQSEAKAELRRTFDLSDRQAQAVLDLRLGRLTHLDVFKLEKDLAEVRTMIQSLMLVLASKTEQMNIVKTEMLLVKRNYKEPRRTVILNNKEEYVVPSEDDAKPIENFMIAYNISCELKRIPLKNFSLASKEFSDKTSAHDICPILMPAKTNDVLYCFTDKGNCYKLDVDALPETKWRDKGMTLETLIDISTTNEHIVNMFIVGDKMPTGKLLFFTKLGMVKQSAWSEYGVVKSNFQAIKLRDDDLVIRVEEMRSDTTMMMVTAQGMCINADRSDVPDQGRIAGGVRGINLSDNDYVVGAEQVNNNGHICLITNRGFAKRVEIASIDVMVRYRKGVKVMELKDDANETRVVFAKCVTTPTNIVIEQEQDYFMQCNSEDLRIEPRTSKGRTICKIAKGEEILGVALYNS